MHTTLNQIRAHNPCVPSWRRGLALLGKTSPDDEPIPIIAILDALGFEDAIWCLRAVEGSERDIRLLAVAFASEVRHLMPDPRSHRVLEVAVAVANGLATEEELAQAREAARAAYRAAYDAYAYAAAAAADAAYAAADAYCAAYAAADAAAAAWAAAAARADAARAAANDAGRRAAAAFAAMRARQAEILREFCSR